MRSVAYNLFSFPMAVLVFPQLHRFSKISTVFHLPLNGRIASLKELMTQLHSSHSQCRTHHYVYVLLLSVHNCPMSRIIMLLRRLCSSVSVTSFSKCQIIFSSYPANEFIMQLWHKSSMKELVTHFCCETM